MNPHSRLFLAAAASLFLASCATTSTSTSRALPPAPLAWGNTHITQDLIPAGHFARKRTRPLQPTYITIHATEAYPAAANARAHARMQREGSLTASKNSLGYVSWHFTVDDHSIYQSLPTNEQGQHADYEGQGNQSSIGIEMCENRGNSRERTLERTAQLTARLMKQFNIPLNHIVPHQHWLMIRYADGRNLGHKTCPHFLVSPKLGESDPRWQAFLQRVSHYRGQL